MKNHLARIAALLTLAILANQFNLAPSTHAVVAPGLVIRHNAIRPDTDILVPSSTGQHVDSYTIKNTHTQDVELDELGIYVSNQAQDVDAVTLSYVDTTGLYRSFRGVPQTMVGRGGVAEIKAMNLLIPAGTTIFMRINATMKTPATGGASGDEVVFGIDKQFIRASEVISGHPVGQANINYIGGAPVVHYAFSSKPVVTLSGQSPSGLQTVHQYRKMMVLNFARSVVPFGDRFTVEAMDFELNSDSDFSQAVVANARLQEGGQIVWSGTVDVISPEEAWVHAQNINWTTQGAKLELIIDTVSLLDEDVGEADPVSIRVEYGTPFHQGGILWRDSVGNRASWLGDVSSLFIDGHTLVF